MSRPRARASAEGRRFEARRRSQAPFFHPIAMRQGLWPLLSLPGSAAGRCGAWLARLLA